MVALHLDKLEMAAFVYDQLIPIISSCRQGRKSLFSFSFFFPFLGSHGNPIKLGPGNRLHSCPNNSSRVPPLHFKPSPTTSHVSRPRVITFAFWVKILVFTKKWTYGSPLSHWLLSLHYLALFKQVVQSPLNTALYTLALNPKTHSLNTCLFGVHSQIRRQLYVSKFLL